MAAFRGAYVNLGADYLVGIPVALLMGFVGHLRGLGLWSGPVVEGATVVGIRVALLMGFVGYLKGLGLWSGLVAGAAMVGIPVDLLMGFVGYLRGLGLWSDMAVGATLESIIFSLITSPTTGKNRSAYEHLFNWKLSFPRYHMIEAIEARHRIFEGATKTPAVNELATSRKNTYFCFHEH